MSALRISALAFAALAALALPAPAGPVLTETGRAVLSHPDPALGGLSGLLVSADGSRFTAVGDRGILVTGRLIRDEGALTGAIVERVRPLLDPKGATLRGDLVDAEGLAPDGAGGVLVSFEAVPRIWRYTGPGAKALPGPSCPAFAELQLNSGLEALARGPDGTVYAIPERSGAWAKPFPVWRMRGGACLAPLALPRRGVFLVTGADIGPDGRLWVLERHFSLLGFATRVRRFALGEAGLGAEETLLETPPGALGNMEGIAVRRDEAGRLRVLLLADDNFSPFQTALLVEFRLEEAPAP